MNKLISISTLILVVINTYYLYINDYYNNKIIFVDDVHSSELEVVDYQNKINYYTNSNNNNMDFRFDIISNEDLISNSIYRIEKILDIINYEVIDKLFEQEDGLDIYLTDTISYHQVNNPNGLSYYQNNKYNIVIDISKSDIEEVFSHELMHVMENYLKRHHDNIFSEWNTFNPPDFKYYNDYNYPSDIMYTISDINNEYFVNSYAKTYEIEDRAILFSHICAYNNYYDSYPFIHKKTIYLLDELSKYYGFDIFIPFY